MSWPIHLQSSHGDVFRSKTLRPWKLASCRYWLADSYEQRHAAGQEPQNVDKEFLRLWFRQSCDPYNDEVCMPFLTVFSFACLPACPTQKNAKGGCAANQSWEAWMLLSGFGQ